MPNAIKPPGYQWFSYFENLTVRVGVYSGMGMAVTFSAWVVVANRMAWLERFALERNLMALTILILFALVPVVRFYRAPPELLLSGVLAWAILCVVFRLLSLGFTLLEEYYSAFHIFVLGALVYLITATLSWIGTIIWQVRVEHLSGHRH